MEGRLVREMQLVRRPAMKQGDLLLASAAILHGGAAPSDRLLSCSFISLTAPPSVGSLATPALSRGTTVVSRHDIAGKHLGIWVPFLKMVAVSLPTGHTPPGLSR